MNFDRLVEIAKSLKRREQTGTNFHVTFALRHSKIVLIGINDCIKTHPLTINYENVNWAKGSVYLPRLHSEADIVRQIRRGELSDYTLVNIRILNTDKLGMACPCVNCFELLRKHGAKHIFYSDALGGFSKLIF